MQEPWVWICFYNYERKKTVWYIKNRLIYTKSFYFTFAFSCIFLLRAWVYARSHLFKLVFKYAAICKKFGFRLGLVSDVIFWQYPGISDFAALRILRNFLRLENLWIHREIPFFKTTEITLLSGLCKKRDISQSWKIKLRVTHSKGLHLGKPSLKKRNFMK